MMENQSSSEKPTVSKRNKYLQNYVQNVRSDDLEEMLSKLQAKRNKRPVSPRLTHVSNNEIQSHFEESFETPVPVPDRFQSKANKVKARDAENTVQKNRKITKPSDFPPEITDITWESDDGQIEEDPVEDEITSKDYLRRTSSIPHKSNDLYDKPRERCTNDDLYHNRPTRQLSPKPSTSKKHVYDSLFATSFFKTALDHLISEEDKFLIQYISIKKNHNYIQIWDDSKKNAIEVFGRVDDLIEFHTEFKDKLKTCQNIKQFSQLIIDYKPSIKLHVADQWKLCQMDGPTIYKKHTTGNPKFPWQSHQQIKQYMYHMQLLNVKEPMNQTIDTFSTAYSIILDTFTQVEYVNNALKQIVEPSIILSECGDVLYKNRLYRASLLGKGAEVEVFVTEKYIIFTEHKGGKYIFKECMPVRETQYKPQANSLRIEIGFRNSNKKGQTLIAPDDNDFTKFTSAIQYALSNSVM